MPKKPLFEIDKRSVRRLQRQLGTFRNDVNQELPREMGKMMASVLQQAKEDSPVKTGRLKASGYLVQSKNGKTVNYEVRFGGQVIKGEFVDYAVGVEAKEPFLIPAFDRQKQSVLRDLNRRMDKLLEAASKLR